MTYNKSEIMKNAWRKTRALGSALQFAMGGIRAVFAQMLKQAWADARAAKPAKLTKTEAKHQLMLLDNKTRWNTSDFQQSAELARAINAA